MTPDDLQIDDLWVVRKAARESGGVIAQHMLWTAIKRIARKHAYGDGFVDWNVIENIFDKHFGDADKREKP